MVKTCPIGRQYDITTTLAVRYGGTFGYSEIKMGLSKEPTSLLSNGEIP